MKIRRSTLAACLTSLLLTGCGITGNLRGHPGFAAFERPGGRYTDRNFALSVGPIPLRIGRVLARPILADEPELFEIAKDVQAVRVYVYDVTDDSPAIREHISATQARLVGRGWEPVVAIRDDGGWVSALVRLENAERMRGLVVMMQDPTEVVLVNVIGRFEPSTFAELMGFLEIEAPTVEIEPPAAHDHS